MKYNRKTIELTKVIPIIWALIILLILVLALWIWESVTTPQTFLSPLVSEVQAQERIVVEYKLPETIEDEIRSVFGEYADEAFKILECENRNLDPEAVNINKDSKDLGVFQINTKWHGFLKSVNNERYLFDPAINIRIAWRIFEDSGYSFKLWSCYE